MLVIKMSSYSKLINDPLQCLRTLSLNNNSVARIYLTRRCMSTDITTKDDEKCEGQSKGNAILNNDSCPNVHKLSSKMTKELAPKFSNLTPPHASEFPNWAYEPRDFFHYELIYESKRSMARVGKIHTPHGTIDTPSFVAVATNGALKVCNDKF